MRHNKAEPQSSSMGQTALQLAGLWYSELRPMRILFAISLVALAALLWASVSIAQHVYRSRRSKRTLPSEAKRRPLTAVPPAPASSDAGTAEDTGRQRKAS